MPFEAILFDPQTGNSTKTSVRAFGSTLEVTGGPETLRLDPAKCALSAGGWDRESLQLSWPGPGGTWALSTTSPVAGEELSRIPAFRAAIEEAGRAQRGARRSGRLGLAIVAALTLLPVLILVGALVFRDRIIDFALARVPVSVDQEVGKMFEGEFIGGKSELKDNEATRAIDEIVDRLKAAGSSRGFEFKVSVQRSTDVNAFAAPGGLIVVYTGLIEKAGSAEEVAGVLAHEMAHVTNRHSIRQLLYAGGLLPLLGLLVGEPTAASLFQNLGRLSELKFSRAQEDDADRTGFSNLVAAGISTEGMARFFDRLAEADGAAPAFVSTHPASAFRAAAIRARAKSSGAVAFEALDIDWERVRASIR